MITNLKETATIDLIMRAYDVIDDLIKVNPSLTDNEKKDIMDSFESKFNSYISMLNIAWMPTSNTFRPILDVNTKNKNITIDSENPYNQIIVAHNILEWGNGFFSRKLLDTLDSLVYNLRDDPISNEAILSNYLIYMSYMGDALFDFILEFLFHDVEKTLPWINPNDSMAYIFLSYLLNSSWNHVVNRDAICIVDLDNIKTLWLKPTIAVYPDLKIVVKNLDLVDMSSVLMKK